MAEELPGLSYAQARAIVARGRVGYRIAGYRARRGWSQQQLADAMDVTREYVSMLESGKRSADRYSLLLAVASTLGVDVSVLMTPAAGAVVGSGARLLLDLTATRACVEQRNGRSVLVISDGVLRVELKGSGDAVKLARDGAAGIADAVAVLLRGGSW